MEVYIPSFRYEESELERGYTVSLAAPGRARPRPRGAATRPTEAAVVALGWGGGGTSKRGGEGGSRASRSRAGGRAAAAEGTAMPGERPRPGGFQQRPPPRSVVQKAGGAGFFPHVRSFGIASPRAAPCR